MIAVSFFVEIAHVMKGGINDSHQFCLGRAARVLHAKPLNERSNVSSQRRRVNIFAKISRLLSLLESLSRERRLALTVRTRHSDREPNKVGDCALLDRRHSTVE